VVFGGKRVIVLQAVEGSLWRKSSETLLLTPYGEGRIRKELPAVSCKAKKQKKKVKK